MERQFSQTNWYKNVKSIYTIVEVMHVLFMVHIIVLQVGRLCTAPNSSWHGDAKSCSCASYMCLNGHASAAVSTQKLYKMHQLWINGNQQHSPDAISAELLKNAEEPILHVLYSEFRKLYSIIALFPHTGSQQLSSPTVTAMSQLYK